MKQIKRKMGSIIQRIVDWGMGNGLMQEELTADGHDMVTPEMAALARRAGAEGCVLLKNDGTLPLKGMQKVAVFGRCQLDWFYVGYGSGGDVNPPYRVSLIEGLNNAGILFDETVAAAYLDWCSSEENQADHGWWGHWPMSHPEMPLGRVAVNAAAHVACARSVITKVDLDGPVLCSEDPILGGAVFKEKDITVSDGPGLGIIGIENGRVTYLD